MKTVHEMAKLTGLTVRTLHYYDEIGLLRPSRLSDSGYRLYDEPELRALQQVMFFRELGFPLSDIRVLMDAEINQKEKLEALRELLFLQRDRLDRLIALISEQLDGTGPVRFAEFDASDIEDAKRDFKTGIYR